LLPLNFENFLTQPWSLLTYGFLDVSFWTLFTNMIWLWLFGSILEDAKGTNRIFPIFWFGFVFSGFVLLIVQSFLPQSALLYASTLGGVAAVAAASITFKPRAVVYAIFNKGVPVYFFGILFLSITIYINWQNLNAMVLLVSGGFLGFLSQNLLHQFFERIRDVFARARSYFSSNENFIKKKHLKESMNINVLNAQLQKIITKLNANGLESLSKEEIDILKFHNKL